MKNAQGTVSANCNQFLLHVDLNSRKSCPPIEPVASILKALIAPETFSKAENNE